MHKAPDESHDSRNTRASGDPSPGNSPLGNVRRRAIASYGDRTRRSDGKAPGPHRLSTGHANTNPTVMGHDASADIDSTFPKLKSKSPSNVVRSPNYSNSATSMSPNFEHPEASPQVPIERLSLDERPPPIRAKSRPRSGGLPSPSGIASKRGAPHEPTYAFEDQPPTKQPHRGLKFNGMRSPATRNRDSNDRRGVPAGIRPLRSSATLTKPLTNEIQLKHDTKVTSSRPRVKPQPSLSPRAEPKRATSVSKHNPRAKVNKLNHPLEEADIEMILQPDSSPISEEQLRLEIKGIYQGLATVEAKCIDIDAALATDLKSLLGVEQWQALIALHRTLLYEHHDFLMATQHPSASPELKGLAMGYNMPARMWKHGIHAFLEVLRHRRPESQDYMLAFVVLAYQMMALLYETVPCFTDTWIECLGDLARYRMAIEEDREIHAIWGGVAARWYTVASDRHPDIGRLYHHLGILERPSLRKFASYAKSLTSVVPFSNARDSLTTFCKPIAQDEQMSQVNSSSSVESSLVTFYAEVYLSQSQSEDAVQKSALEPPGVPSHISPSQHQEFGVQLVITSVSAVLEFGATTNVLCQGFSTVINKTQQFQRPSEETLSIPTDSGSDPSQAATLAAVYVVQSYFGCINAPFQAHDSTIANNTVLAPCHAVLIWMHGLHWMQTQIDDQHIRNTVCSLMDPTQFSWGGLCLYLNRLCRHEPIDAQTFECAEQGTFPQKRAAKVVPLPEDYWIRGLLWAHSYSPKDCLPDRADEIESDQSPKERIKRVLCLALILAFQIPYLKYDNHMKAFWTPESDATRLTSVSEPVALSTTCDEDHSPAIETPYSPTSTTSRSSATVSTTSDSDGWTFVHRKGKSDPHDTTIFS